MTRSGHEDAIPGPMLGQRDRVSVRADPETSSTTSEAEIQPRQGTGDLGNGWLTPWIATTVMVTSDLAALPNESPPSSGRH